MAEETPQGNQPGQAGDPTAAAQQPQAGEPDGKQKAPEAQDVVSRAELEKVIGERQSLKERLRASDQRVAELQGDPRLKIEPERIKALDDLEAKQDAAARDKAMKEQDVEAIESRVREPMQKQIDALQTRGQVRNDQITALLKTQALKVAATAANAVIPDQVVGLLQDRVRMVEDAATGQFRPEYFDAENQPMYDGNGQRIADADTFVKAFLALPDNSNLVKANTPPGSGAQPTGGPTNNRGAPTSVEAFNALPEAERAEAAQSMTAEQIDAAAGVVKAGTAGHL